jgi:hypothetical protein
VFLEALLLGADEHEVEDHENQYKRDEGHYRVLGFGALLRRSAHRVRGIDKKSKHNKLLLMEIDHKNVVKRRRNS